MQVAPIKALRFSPKKNQLRIKVYAFLYSLIYIFSTEWSIEVIHTIDIHLTTTLNLHEMPVREVIKFKWSVIYHRDC